MGASRWSKDVARQGTPTEDFILNAITMNAYGGYGRTLASHDGMISDAFTSKPFYSVSLSYGIDLERLYEHVRFPDSRPVDPGYYYQTIQPPFWPKPVGYNNDRPN
jgi:hypothetical protein